MSVKNFKFVSPGVFINEIDNSFIPKSADSIGPVVIGRASRGISMQPVKATSYSEFVEFFGPAVPGAGGGDISRDGNFQSPMYGTYAAQAFLAANVAPLTYVRTLGYQHAQNDGTVAAQAGWQTDNTPSNIPLESGGAYALWLCESGSDATLGDMRLGAVFYVNDGAIALSGTIRGGQGFIGAADGGKSAIDSTASLNTVIGNDSNNLFTLVVTGTTGQETLRFGFDDTSSNFLRKRVNTNPQLVSTPGAFYPSASAKDYWLGESYEQEIRDNSLTGDAQAVMLMIGSASAASKPGTTSTIGPSRLKNQNAREAVAGWFIGQDLKASADYVPFNAQKLFRLHGRGHGQWLQKNVKVSIEKIRQSNTTTSDYGSFSLVLRSLMDTDSNIVLLERYDNLTLDPTSPNFIARRIGDQFQEWDSTARRLKTYGDFPNLSNFVRVEMNADVEAGATDPLLLPFGYIAPPRFKGITNLTNNGSEAWATYVTGALGTPYAVASVAPPNESGMCWAAGRMPFLSGGTSCNTKTGANARENTICTGSLSFPYVRVRLSASDGGLSDPTNAYFGMQTTREASSTRSDESVKDYHNLLYASFPDDPTDSANFELGVDPWSYVFSLDDVVRLNASQYFYQSGSRVLGSSYSATNDYAALLDADYNQFTAPFWGGFDGFDIKYPDPLYNDSMSSTSTETNSYVYNTWKRAIDTVSDPEYLNMNMLSAPGLTLGNLTTHLINVCAERADALGLIDLPDVYIPAHEKYYADKKSRIGTTPNSAATALKNRRLDSSYGCTFYPWVQTRDSNTGTLLWIPPTAAMLGVFASSQASTDVWFAPAGFNRGGLTDGAAGIPITAVSERLVSKDRDTLYEARINPIASFPSSGIVVFGQKTLQELPSALDRINVRRLVIYLKKQISILATQVLFEQNVEATWLRFKNLVEPFLSNVLAGYGITDYRLVLDENTTTPDLIDQNVMYAKIMIKPARAIEYIAIDFVVLSTGASFDD